MLVVHRPAYDDWTFPKGKREPGETDEQTAVREVEEETGLRCVLGAELATTSYVANGLPKQVRYWALAPANPDEARAQSEADEIAWLEPSDAAARLSYDTDREVLHAFVAVGQNRSP